jgi:glycosyltransferase involved in cell wall biosynthesis
MSSRQNICFFNTTKFWGGGEKWHFEAAVKASYTENQVFFVCQKKGELAKKLSGYEVVQEHINVNNRSFLNPIKVKQLAAFFTKNNIDTVVFNSPKDLKLGGKSAKKAGIKNIVYRRGIAVEVKNKPLNIKLFKEVVTHFIFNSKATRELLIKNFDFILKEKKTAVIYNAIDFPKEVTQFKNKNNTIVIGNAGRLVEQKGQHFLIDIANHLKSKELNFKIKIAGDGPLFNDLKERVFKESLEDHIELLGFVKDVGSFMSGIDIFVSTALWEGFGFVLAEAMVAKKPVIAFDLSSNPELVLQGKNGYLIPVNDTVQFADSLAELIQNKDKRIAMGNAGFEYAKANFEANKQFEKFMEFIRI